MSEKVSAYFKASIRRAFRTKWGKEEFCLQYKGKNARILDVGCGNGSPFKIKQLAPDSYYVGVDVGDYNNTSATLAYADEYYVFEPEGFADGISGLCGEFDAIISNHNIEHCNYPEKTLTAMCSKLKIDGMLYMAFPSEASANFPHREGTLNFYDDPTHSYLPVFDDVIRHLKENGMEIAFADKQYKPTLFYFAGGCLNLLAACERKS